MQNVQSDILNVDFCCKYISGKPTTSDESTDVCWFPIDIAVNMTGNPLYEKRMRNMLSRNTNIHCFAFTKQPFEIRIDDELKVGL